MQFKLYTKGFKWSEVLVPKKYVTASKIVPNEKELCEVLHSIKCLVNNSIFSGGNAVREIKL